MSSIHRGVPRVAGQALMVASLLWVGCAGHGDRQTLAQLRNVEPDLQEVEIDDGIGQAMVGYRKFLEEAPESSLTPEAMRRLADLKLEKEYGVLAPAERTAAALPAPTRTEAAKREERAAATGPQVDRESDQEFEARASRETVNPFADAPVAFEHPGGVADRSAGPLEAIALYDKILATYPNYPQNDQVLYQKARAYEELGRLDEAIEVAALLASRYPESRHLDEINFRRGEYFFTRKKMIAAEEAYAKIVAKGPRSDYYELALYKLGWTFYKQMLMEEALDTYVRLLDYKVSTGYDFDQVEDEAASQRVADTYRVISLCFSDLGGAEAVASFFVEKGHRDYENRIYRHLGDFYFEKLRYNDAALVFEAFVDLYPVHREAPHFSMRVVEIYEAGGFPKLVLESKKAFAERYSLQSQYWQHFTVQELPEVLEYLKGNLEDLANHYHALYQNPEREDERSAHFAESSHWYGEYLSSFPDDPKTPEIHYQFADLLLENEAFANAARQYEHIAYDYAPHERSAAAGYAAIFARREHHKRVDESEEGSVRRTIVASTLRFVERFPDHEHAAAVLGAAVDDLYVLEDFESAIQTAKQLIGTFPDADPSIRRSAWNVIAHSSFDLEAFEAAEHAYAEVLGMTDPDDQGVQDVMNNLAAAIYKQGERANAAEDYGQAAEHFLRIAESAPLSDIRPVAEYDAGAALIRLEDWSGAIRVFESFRQSHPDHELRREATRQLAFVYREEENYSLAAEEYERVADEAEEPELRREALWVAGELYEKAQMPGSALGVFEIFVSEFTVPIEPVVVTRFKMAELYEQMGEMEKRHTELERIVRIDREAGEERTDGVRVLAAKSALILTEDQVQDFREIDLVQPFEKSLQKKQRRMNAALAALGSLVDYEVGEVTAAATFYMAEVYGEFSRALLESERPVDLSRAELLDYEGILEEEAFPFEEKAIDVHEKNLELMAAGVFNEWIENSLGRLAVLMPGRYAKFESSGGMIESIETYTYRTPASERQTEFARTQEPTPIAVEETVALAVDPGADDAAPGDATAAAKASETEDAGPDDSVPPAAPMPTGPAADQEGASVVGVQEEAHADSD